MPRILTVDIETQRAIVEVFDLWPKYIPIDRVKTPTRILCFAAKWHDEDEVLFEAAWEDDDVEGYRRMIASAWELLDSADVVVTWNGNRFDLQWFDAEFARLEMGPASPYKSLDLFSVAKRRFKAGLMSLKLDWSARQWLGDRKISHEGVDLWDQIRYGNKRQRKEAVAMMMDYCIHDTVLTDKLIDRYLPWTGLNLALYDADGGDGKMRCTKCLSENLHKRGFFYTTAYAYQRYRCMNPKCGAWNKGAKMVYSTELRPL